MEKILSMKIEDMPGYFYNCPCGRRHSVDIENISVGEDILVDLPKILGSFKGKKILLVWDDNTKRVAPSVPDILTGAGFDIEIFTLEKQNNPIIVPDEYTVGSILIATGDDIGLLLGVGSGTVNDLCKIVSYKMKLPSVTVATAPSMDGYASTLSPLIVKNSKVTYPSHYPYAIVADVSILKNAPKEMLLAGFGDIVGKYTALADWQLTVKINSEYYCETTVQLVKNAVNKCVSVSEQYIKRDPEAVKSMMEALILSGIAMGLVGISRPASGSEHHLAHFWELDALAKNKEHPLHGNSVGAGCVVVATAYKLLKDKYEELADIEVPDPEYLKSIYSKIGAAASPKDLGIEKEVFRDSVRNAYRIRPRYTIFNFTKNHGYLDMLADILTDMFY
ncbi:MAG: sn-glycerol-1-phosphate dehydrogenase [Clostridiales bacterium]|nr:sn-glycerol-1-phosphate dehydrogenase [Clostridiales bacterium]